MAEITIDPENLSPDQQAEDSSFIDSFLEESKPKTVGVQDTEITRRATQGAIISDDPAAFSTIQQEYIQSGSSDSFDIIEQQAAAELRQKAEPVLLDIAESNSTISDKRIKVEALLETLDERTPTDYFRDTLAVTGAASDLTSVEQQEDIFRGLSLREKKEQASVKYSTKEFTFLGGGLEQMFDTAVVMAAPGFGVNVREIIEEAIPGFTTDFQDLALTGTLVKRWVEHIDALPFEEAEDLIRRTAVIIENNKFYGVENGFMKYDMFITLLEDLNPDNVHDTMLNIVGMLDLVGGAFALRGGVRGAIGIAKFAKEADKAEAARIHIQNFFHRKRKDSLSSDVDQHAPEDSLELHQAALLDEPLAHALGTDPLQLTSSHMLPLPPGVDADLAPTLLERVTKVLKQKVLGVSLTDAEKSIARNRTIDKQITLSNSLARVHLNKSTIKATPQGYEMESVFGRTAARGFINSDEALKHFDNLVTSHFTSPEVLVTSRKTGTLQRLDDVPLEERGSEYWLRVKQTENFRSSDVLPINPILPDGVIGWWAKYFNKSASFIRSWALGGSVSADVMSAKVAELNGLLVPINKLPPRSQQEVLNVIDEGDQQVHWFSYDELVLRWGHREDYVDLIKGYQSFKVHQREARDLLNDALYNRAVSQELKHVKFLNLPKGDRLARVLKDIPPGLRQVYSPSENRIINVNETDLKIFEREHKQLVELSSPMRFDGIETKYAFIDNKASLKELPRQLLKDQGGYVSRLYDMSHMVREIHRGTNSFGEDSVNFTVLRGAKNAGDAERYANELRASGKVDQEFEVVEVNELRKDFSDDSYVDRLSLEYFEEQGQLFYSSRGTEELLGIDGERIVSSISDRLEAMRVSAARADTLDGVVDKMIKQWEATFGEAFGRNGKIRLYGELPEKGVRDKAKRRHRNDAIATRDHIKTVAGIDDTIFTKSFNNAVLGAADFLATPKVIPYASKALNWTSGKLVKHRTGLNPVNVAKQGAFLQFIVGNPVRQLLLQSQQASVYLADTHALRYFAGGQGFKDYAGLIAGLSHRTQDTWEMMAPIWAKNLEMSVDEYTDFVDGIRQQGLLTNIDSHEFVSMMALDARMGGGTGAVRAREAFWEGMKRSVKLIRKYGFDAGEKSQLLAAYLVKRNKFIIDNPKENWVDHILEIGGEARQISLNMNQAGALQFQKGFTGLLMQFMSHNTKMAQILLPRTMFGKTNFITRMSDKSWNRNQKMALLANQSSIYGLGGWGLYEMYDELKASLGGEPPPSLDLLIKEGLSGTFWSAAFSAFDEDPEFRTALDASGSIAPFSGVLRGTPINKLYDTQIFSQYQLTDIPGFSTASSVGKALRTVGYLTGVGVNELLNLDPETNLPADDFISLEILDTIVRVVPMLDKFSRGRAQLAVERFITGSGTATVRATAGEIVASGLFGFQPTRRRELEGTLREVLGGAGDREEGLNDNLKTHARMVYDTAIRILQQQGDSVATMSELEDMVKRLSVLDKFMYSDFNYEFMYNQYMPDLIYSRSPITTKEAKTLNDIEYELHDALDKKIGVQQLETTDTILDKIKNFENTPHKEQYIEWLEAIRD